MSNENVVPGEDLSTTYHHEVIDPETGEIKKALPQMVAPTAAMQRLHKNGSEKLDPRPLVSPLLRPPSLKQRVEAMVRSGELAQLIRMEQNMRDDDDNNFEGYDRNFSEEIPTIHELAHVRNTHEGPPQAPQTPPQASSGPPATTLPPDGAQRAHNAGEATAGDPAQPDNGVAAS